jgi:autotransporter-associated beta strand protein
MAAEVAAEAQTRVVVRADQPRLESRIVFHIGRRKIYRLEVALPDDLAAPEVILPAAGQWTIAKQDRRNVLRAELEQGVEGDPALIVRGKLGAVDGAPARGSQEMSLPQVNVLGIKRQEGDIAVQADPAFNVEARELRNVQDSERQRVDAWLDVSLRAATRVALHYSGGDYSGRLRLVARKPEIVCDTISNVKVTDRAIEETIMLNFEIRNAGVRELTFLLPASMRDARISSPMLRRKTVAPADPKDADGPVRVRLELQGDAMNDLRVLVENDRLLPTGSYVAPVPSFEAAGGGADFLRHRYVVLESSNRDELVVDPPVGVEPLSRQQQQWQALCGLLGTNNLYKAYLAEAGAQNPRVSFHLVAHEELQTAGARIDLAETTMVVDANGAYRAKVEFTLDNSSEQFLDVELPKGAELWTVHVAGEPVKPARPAGAGEAVKRGAGGRVLLPVVKTAKGDLSYPVVLKYGGKLPALSPLAAMRFPLVRDVKSYPRGVAIGIGRSQLQLYLPRSHDWYDFDGTLHPSDEGQQRAARIAALNELGGRLMEAARDKDPFTRLRASNNLKNWIAESRNVQAETGRRDYGELKREIDANIGEVVQAWGVVEQNDEEYTKALDGRVTGAPNAAPQADAAIGNRQRLNELYGKQVVKNATGALDLSGANSYSGGTTVTYGALGLQNSGEFNGNWFARNNLNGGQSSVSSAKALPGGTTSQSVLAANNTRNVNFNDRRDSAVGQEAFLGTITINGAPNGPVSQAAQANPNAYFNYGQNGMPAQQSTKSGAGTLVLSGNGNYSGATTLTGGTLQMGNGATLDTQKQELAQYQQKLMSNPQIAGGAIDITNGSMIVTNSTFGFVARAQNGQSGNGQQAAGDAKPAESDRKKEASTPALTEQAQSVAGNAPTGQLAIPAAPTGLASLDFELPTDTSLYQVYRFSTPLGEANLTARAISGSTVSRLISLAAIVAAVVVLWLVVTLIGRGLLGVFRHPLGATLLLAVGIAMLCGGILPVVALVGIVVGIWHLIAWAMARRRRFAEA